MRATLGAMTTHTLTPTHIVQSATAAPECAEFCELSHTADRRDEWRQGGGRECLSHEAVDQVHGFSVQASRWAGPDGAIEPVSIVLTTPDTVHTLTLRDAEALQFGIADALRMATGGNG
jgi:hypothetical protein